MQKTSVMLLHRFDDLDDGGVEVVSGVVLANELPVLDRVLERDRHVPPDDRPGYRLFCGYSGWGAGQLDAELRAGGWLILPANHEHVFQIAPDSLWTRALGELGGRYKLFSLMPPNPDCN